MAERIKNLRALQKAEGLSAVTGQIVQHINNYLNRLKYRRFLNRLDGKDAASTFSEIYEKGLWRTGESLSGAGSEESYTVELRAALPIVFERFGIRKILDAPCGDFHWMRLVPLAPDMTYTGLDIVSPVIEENQRRYGDAQHQFAVANLLHDPLPPADIIICRDCLFHLSNRDAALALQNFVNSGAPYLLTSTHLVPEDFVNTDIRTGEFRLIDLFAEPFCFPRDVLYRIKDFVPPFPPREMCLWDKAQVASVLPGLSRMIA